MTEKRKVFIVGSARSGTTAFARLLGQHGQIVMGIERYIRLPRETAIPDWGDEVFTKDHFFGPDLRVGAQAAHYAIQWPKFDTAAWVGDKVPSWISSHAQLRARYPDCVIFVTVRDPAAIGLSWERLGQRDTGFFAGKTFRNGLAIAKNTYAKTKAILETGDARFHPVIYEKLFPYNPDYLAKVLSRLDLDLDDAISAFYRADSKSSARITEKPRPLTEGHSASLKEIVDPEVLAYVRERAV